MCLRRHHLSHDCRSGSKCSHCSGWHHTSICKDSHVKRSSGNGNQPSSRTATAQSLTVSTQPPSSSQSAHTSTATGPPNSTVLLQTTQAYIHNPDNPSHKITVRLMSDGGSQCSYIAKDAQRLESHRVKEVNIQTFRSDNTKTQNVEVVKAAISLKEGGTTNVLFSTVPLICKPLSCKPIAYTKQKYHHLAELELADSSQVGEEL